MNVPFLATLLTLKACTSPYMQRYFKRYFVLHSSEVTFSFLIKKSRQKAIEIEIAFFHPFGNPKGRTLDHFFYASHIRHNFPLKLIKSVQSALSDLLTTSASHGTFSHPSTKRGLILIGLELNTNTSTNHIH